MANVITITSGKGGVGKTFFSINFSRYLSILEFKTLLIDYNLSTPNISINLRIRDNNKNIHKFLRGEIGIRDCIHNFRENLDIIPGSLRIEDIVYTDISKIYYGIQELYNDYDYIIIDSAAGIGREALEAIKYADEIFIVTNPKKSALLDAYRVIKVSEKLNIKILGVILNRFREDKKIPLHKLEMFLTKPIYGIIHEDKYVEESMEIGVPLVDLYPDSIAAKDIEKIVLKFTGKNIEGEKKGLLDKIFSIFRWR